MRATGFRGVVLGGSSLVVFSLGMGMAAPPRRPPARPRPSPSPTAVSRPAEATWGEADRLVGPQKGEAAAAVAAQIRPRAPAGRDKDRWLRPVVREAQLPIALHRDGTVVLSLRATPWP